jgi:hypothetical protein
MLAFRNWIFVFACFFFLLALLIVVPVPTSRSQQNQPLMEKDSPPDTFDYGRPAIQEDLAPGGRPALPTVNLPSAIFPTPFVRDLVVSNTNPNLTNTDTANDGEPSIAINPSNTNEIVISAFSGSWERTRRSGIQPTAAAPGRNSSRCRRRRVLRLRVVPATRRLITIAATAYRVLF